jgi:hypothetical protein
VGDLPFDDILQALGRLIVERFQETSKEQTGDLLAGGGTLLERLVQMLSGGFIEWAVRAVFLLAGVTARTLLLAFGPQAEFLRGMLVGVPPELTTGVPEVRDAARVVQIISMGLLPLAIAWSGFGYMFSFTDGGSEGFAKRLVGGGVLVGAFPFLLELAYRVVHQIGMAIAGGGDVIPGYTSISEAVTEGIVVAAAVTPPVSGPPGGALSESMLDLASHDSVAAGAIAFVYAGALVMGGAAAAARIAVLDGLYVLSPLVALALVTPIVSSIFAVWGRALLTCLLVILPAGVILKLAAALMLRVAQGGPLWVALFGAAAVLAYATLVGRASFGLAFSAPGMARRIVTVVGGR